MNNSTDYFEGAFKDGHLKTISIVATLFSVFFLVPAGYGIIWYEKYGSDAKRILVNRLLTSACWTGIDMYFLIMPIDIARYIYGPLPELVCLFQLLHKNALNIFAMIFCDFVSMTRYIYLFHLKNPGEFKDEFWHIFINIWTVCFGLASQFAFLYSPGQQPIYYFICTGKNPGKSNVEPKINFLMGFLLATSVILQFAIAFKFVVHRMKMDSASTYAYIETFWRENVFDILICLAFFFISFLYGYLLFSIHSIDPVLLNVYPNYIYLYGIHFGFPLFSCGAFVVIFYAKNNSLRAIIMNGVFEFINQH